jgi:hypothetical protein
MPFCPSCKCEYRPGFARCSDCDMELVESLSDENGPKFNRGKLELVSLGSFSVPMEARMFQDLLESNGIVSILHSDSNAGDGTSFVASPNAILVQEVDFPKGRELYEQYIDGNPSENKELGTDDQDESA